MARTPSDRCWALFHHRVNKYTVALMAAGCQQDKRLNFLVLAPEQLANDEVRTAIHAARPTLFVVEESERPGIVYLVTRQGLLTAAPDTR